MKFFVGTTNPGKVREIAAILSDFSCELEVTDPIDPEETAETFEGNAALKARVYAAHCGAVTIAEDSGILVRALRGLPGPWSARFSDCVFSPEFEFVSHADSGRTREELDQANNERLLHVMRNVPLGHREASFMAALVVADAEGKILFSALGESRGSIALEPKGTNGFGYDPIFIGEDTHGATYAELDSARKNSRSHRRMVLKNFRGWIPRYLEQVQEKV